jgi:hypothetical protein
MEAQCAVLFDKLGWEWEYEKFSLILPGGIPYIPDFWIESRGLIVECRGYETIKSRRQLDKFAYLVEEVDGFSLPGSEYEAAYEFLVIGPKHVTTFTSGRPNPIAASKRKRWQSTQGYISKCGCGWLLRTGWCPNCEKDASASLVLTVSDGKPYVNGSPIEDVFSGAE